MTEETKRIEDVIRKAVEFCEREGAHEFDAPHRVDTALLRSLAAACKAYREAYEAEQSQPEYMMDLALALDRGMAEAALLALARGETPNYTEHPLR